MRKLLPIIGMFFLASAAKADITHSLSSSVQLTVDGPAVQSLRLGSSYSVNGNNITPTDGTTNGAIGGLDLSSITSGVPSVHETTHTVTTAGDAFSFGESYNQGDSIVTTQTSMSSGMIDQPNIYGDTTSYLGGTAGSLAGTINSAGTISITAGGAGTSATGQFVSNITVK